jgi:probable phosphoglycerate mutase
MKLILTRHGETIENQKKICCGHNHGNLSEEGKEQAEKVAIRLKNEKIDCIYSSDLQRAADTARTIAKYHPEVPIKFTSELRESDTGDFTGKPAEELDWKNPPKNLETKENLQKRAKKILDKAYEEYPEGTVLFVAHAFFNKALITTILNQNPECVYNYKQENTAINIFDIKEDKNHVVHLMNCIRHLD